MFFFLLYISTSISWTGHPTFNLLLPCNLIFSSVIFLLHCVTNLWMPLDSRCLRTRMTSGNFCLIYSESLIQRYYHLKDKWKSFDSKLLILSIKQLEDDKHIIYQHLDCNEITIIHQPILVLRLGCYILVIKQTSAINDCMTLYNLFLLSKLSVMWKLRELD